MSTRPAAIWSALLACLFAVLALPTPAQAAELNQIIVQMRDAVSAAELLRYSDANAQLHGLIRAIAGAAPGPAPATSVSGSSTPAAVSAMKTPATA